MDATLNELELDERTVKLRRQNVTRVLRHRRRKREGMRILQIEISNKDLEGFVGLGVLPADRRYDNAAIEAALATLCRAGSRALREARDGDVNALPKRAIDFLVLHRFLPPSQRQDAAAVAASVEKLAVTFNAVSTRWDISAIWRVSPGSPSNGDTGGARNSDS